MDESSKLPLGSNEVASLELPTFPMSTIDYEGMSLYSAFWWMSVTHLSAI